MVICGISKQSNIVQTQGKESYLHHENRQKYKRKFGQNQTQSLKSLILKHRKQALQLKAYDRSDNTEIIDGDPYL